SARPLERFQFSLNQSSLLSYMQSKYPEILSLQSIKGQDIGNAQFILQVRKPVASWVIGDKTYYVDEHGQAFQQNYFSGSYVRIVDESGVSVSDGLVLASGRLLSFVGRVVSGAQTYGLTVTEAHIPNDTTRQLEIRIE